MHDNLTACTCVYSSAIIRHAFAAGGLQMPSDGLQDQQAMQSLRLVR